jgi:hypothetical protein
MMIYLPLNNQPRFDAAPMVPWSTLASKPHRGAGAGNELSRGITVDNRDFDPARAADHCD